MAVIDTQSGVLTLKVVYYGPPGAGKTSNLELLSPLFPGDGSRRFSPRQVGENRIAALEIPAGTLGRLMGLSVAVRLETMQGAVSSVGGGWSQALADADGIVFVADSSPHARIDNFKALAVVRERLESRGRTVPAIPVLMQWNKRDRGDARPIVDMQTELNHGFFPSVAASSLRGTGVAETLIEILKRTIDAAQRKAGGTVPEAEIEQTVKAAIQRLSHSAQTATIERFGATIETQSSAASEGVWEREAVYSVESLGGETDATDLAARMLAALEQARAGLDEESLSALPHGLMAGLLSGCDRTHGSLLLFRQGTPQLEETEIVPGGRDPLNAPQPAGGPTTAATLCSGREPRFITDLPETKKLKSAWIVPLSFSGVTFGGMIIYATVDEHAPASAEQDYWKTAATLTSVYLAWQAAEGRALVTRRTDRRFSLDISDPSDS